MGVSRKEVREMNASVSTTTSKERHGDLGNEVSRESLCSTDEKSV